VFDKLDFVISEILWNLVGFIFTAESYMTSSKVDFISVRQSILVVSCN